MLDFPTLEKGIIERLQPLTAALVSAGIPVSTLPKEVGSYSEDAITGEIAVIIPTVTGITDNRLEISAQTVDIDVVVKFSLGKRYQSQAEERDVLEWCCDQAISLLLGYSPYDDELTKRPLYFKSYELFRPDQMWEAELRFGIEKQIRAFVLDTTQYEVMSVTLVNSLNLLTGTPIKQIGGE